MESTGEGGALYPHRPMIYKDGLLQMDWMVASLEMEAKVDLSMFAKPEDEHFYSEEFAN